MYFFSICIPQYSRYDHLMAQIDRLAEQTFRDFEVCISDDVSPERRWDEVRAHLAGYGMPFSYVVQTKNLRYDANLRATIALANGRYVLLMGNDDRLAGVDTLAVLHRRIVESGYPATVTTNYRELRENRIWRRVAVDGSRASGLAGALQTYRNYSFVSGVLLDRELAQKNATDRWDGSEMYQMGLATKIVADGGTLLGLADVYTEQNIPIPGSTVESYRTKPEVVPRRPRARLIPLRKYASTCWDAVSGAVPPGARGRIAWQILRQTIWFPYPHWLIQFRKSHGWRHSLNIALGMRPVYVLEGMPDGAALRWKARLSWFMVSVVGLLCPASLYDGVNERLHDLIKRKTWR